MINLAPMFAEVILPVKLDWNPTYRVPDGSVSPGDRVRVRFAGRTYTGVIYNILSECPLEENKIQDILCADTGLPAITPEELRLWSFISTYYMCTMGEVYKAAYPLLKTNSEQSAANARARKEESDEKIRKAKEARLSRLEQRLEAKQEALKKRQAMKRSSPTLTEKLEAEIAALEGSIGSRRCHPAALEGSIQTARLSCLQTEAKTDGAGSRHSAKKAAAGKPLVITGPGRCARYIEEIRRTLDEGFDAFVLIPEIAIGDSLQKELDSAFPGQVTLYNSKQSAAVRRRTSDALRASREARIILGTRSALFLPFRNPGLVIVEQEQDISYKQTEPSPRYNARDTAAMFARIHGAALILGSDLPSLETCENCISGKYRLEETPAHDTATLIIDTTAEKRKSGMKGLISIKALEHARAASSSLILRSWEKDEDLDRLKQELPESARIASLWDFLDGRNDEECIILLSADSLFEKGNFRADERVLTTLASLRSRTRTLIIQTGKSAHPVFTAISSDAPSGCISTLLQERKDFNLPPYSRIVDAVIEDKSEARLKYLGSEYAKAAEKAIGMRPMTIPGPEGLTLRWQLPKSGAAAAKDALRKMTAEFEKTRKYPGHIHFDADPA